MQELTIYAATQQYKRHGNLFLKVNEFERCSEERKLCMKELSKFVIRALRYKSEHEDTEITLVSESAFDFIFDKSKQIQTTLLTADREINIDIEEKEMGCECDSFTLSYLNRYEEVSERLIFKLRNVS